MAAAAERLKAQVQRFLDFGPGPRGALLVNNYDWLGKMDVIGFLRDVGKHFPLGAMLAKESVRARMGRTDAGLSYTEFSYQVLQAYDFLRLFQDRECRVQLGGSDQWGNITAGIELIRRVAGEQAFGIVHPLVTKEDGTKFGKTEVGTVWLDAAKTSPYEMYQFWLNTGDADVVKFLKYFTFLSREEIAALEAVTAQAPEQREAQRVLAREVTALVHGEHGDARGGGDQRGDVRRRRGLARPRAARGGLPRASPRSRSGAGRGRRPDGGRSPRARGRGGVQGRGAEAAGRRRRHPQRQARHRGRGDPRAAAGPSTGASGSSGRADGATSRAVWPGADVG